MNNAKFVVGIVEKVLKFSGKGRNGLNDVIVIVIVIERIQKMKKTERDVSGGLNDSLENLRNVIIFQCIQMSAPNGLLESSQ